MAIITFSEQEKYREEVTEPRKKLKKVRSVKVANLDRLRSSMRKEKTRVNQSVASEESYSTVISGTSSPHYMKATTSSARKGSLQTSPVSSSDTRISARNENSSSSSKFNKMVSVQEFSDSAGAYTSIKVKPDKCLKRVPSLKHSKKLSSKKSMKIRARYSQFPDYGINEHEMLEFGILGFQGNTESISARMEINPESPDVSSGAKQKGILERSRSRKLTRLRSTRSSRTKQRQQSRLSGGAAELMSNEEPHYMKGTSSEGIKKNSDKGLTRTSSLRPLRILAKIPSLRPKRRKVKKRPQFTPLSGRGVDRATCSSTLKRTAFPDNIELHSRGGELEGTSTLHVCPYSYCSIHGHRHQAPSQPLKEFISAKRKLFGPQKVEQSEREFSDEVGHYISATTESDDHSRGIDYAESYASQKVMNAMTEDAHEAEDDGVDFLIKIYAKPRKKWATEGPFSNDDVETLDSSTYDQISVGDYEGKLAETLSETSGSEEKAASNGGEQEIYETSRIHDADLDDKTHQQNSKRASLSLPLELPAANGPKSGSSHKSLEPSIAEEEVQNLSKDPFHFASRDSEVGLGDDLINYLSDKQKYTSMWQLIHQQLVSSEAAMNEAWGIMQSDKKEGGDGNSYSDVSFMDVEQSENHHLNEEVGDQVSATDKLETNQIAAIKLVQGALNAILQLDADQQANPVKEVANSSVRENNPTPTSSNSEYSSKVGEIDGKMKLESAENQHSLKQIGNRLMQKEESDEREMSGKSMSKSFSKLRKIFVTAKFIKAMERLKKINPRKPQYLSVEQASANERVYLRHLSMNKRKNTEEWMLDNALRQVISKLDPDQQRRVTQLVEAFETVTPEQEEKSNRHYLVKSVSAPGSKLATPLNEEKKQFDELEQETPISHEQMKPKQEDGVFVSRKGVHEEIKFREENKFEASSTGDKILQESDEINLSDTVLVLSEKRSKSACISTAFDDGNVGNEEHMDTLNVPAQISTMDSEGSLVGDMTSLFFNDKQKYTCMWKLIYQQVASSEASVNEQQGANGFDKEESGGDPNNCPEMNSPDSTLRSYSVEQTEDDDSQSAASEKPELDQSAAIKLVREALSAILKRYEQPTHLQTAQDHHRASDDARDLSIVAPSCTEDASIKGASIAETHTYSNLEDKLHPLQQQVQGDEMKAPQRKMSKSFSKLKKAFATARFIKAMEKLTKKNTMRKSQNLCSDTTSEEERVYLRHRSMVGKKKDEEWMLDYALRQVISKMAPDQQRRVALLVEAFETVDPEQKEKSRCYPLKGEAANSIGLATLTNEANECYLESQQQRSISVEKVFQKQDDAIQPTPGDTSLERDLQEHHDQQVTSADSTLELIENGSRLASVVGTIEERSIGDEETRRAIEFPSSFSTESSEGRPAGYMAAILSDKQKYIGMWDLIYRHVLSNEASTAAKQEVNEVDEEEQGLEANTCQATYDPDSTQSTLLKKSELGEDNQGASFDQSAAINLVKEAINAILQSHEQTSDKKSIQEHFRHAADVRELCYTTSLASTKEISGGETMEMHSNSEPNEKLHRVESTSGPLQQQAKPNEAQETPREISKTFSKLRKAIVTAKFIKAMERLKKISPRKPRHLPAEMAPEEEKVYLRHLSINKRTNEEEWMLDYALRKVISNLDPDQQRKVGLLVEAFETVKTQKKGIGHQTKPEWHPATASDSMTHNKAIFESNPDSRTSYDDEVPSRNADRLDMLGKVAILKNTVQEYHSMKFSGLSTDLPPKILDSDGAGLHIHRQANITDSPVSDPLDISTVRKEEIDVNPMHEPFQNTKDPEQDREANTTKGIFHDKQKNTSMWHLIYQHVESVVSTAESESKLREERTSEDQMNRSTASSEMVAQADADDSDASSTTSELNESDAIKLVREALNDILVTPHDLGNQITSNERITASEEGRRVAIEENPKKSLSRGFSKLRKIIACNKFIKAMEKTQKCYPQKQTGLVLNSDSETGKSPLKARDMGESKGMDEWMLDNVLQKAIAGLAPVQQRRVSLLVEAFEKFNPNPSERGKGRCWTKSEFSDTISSEGDLKEKEDTVSSPNSRLPGGLELKLDRSTTSSREIDTDKSPSLTKDNASKGESGRSDAPCSIPAATSNASRSLSNTCKDPTKIDGEDEPAVSQEERTNSREEAGARLEERTSIGTQLVGITQLASKSEERPPQLEDLEDEWNDHVQNSRSSEKSTSLWSLILQHVTTDMLDKNEAPETSKIDPCTQGDSTEVLERKINNDDSSKLSSKVKSCRDMGVQTPTSFDFQEDEAIKLVEEAVEEILLLQDQIDTESLTSSPTSEQEMYSQNHGDVREPLPDASQITGVATSLHIDTVGTPDEEKTSLKEDIPSSYSTLSKVILCKRFVKAMNKMRKLKARHAQDLSQPSHSEEGLSSLRQISSNDKKCWEEGMLDNALQKVIGNLAPAKKQRVALLVQAFETVGSQPEATNRWRGKA